MFDGERFSNLKKAVANLEFALKSENPDVVYRAGIIQFFEMSFELSWKTMKDFLEYNGYQNVDSPRSVIKTAFQIQMIQDGKSWLECLESRNLMSHIYDEKTAEISEQKIRQNYIFLLKNLEAYLEKQL
nr:nucleotidyltransferase substrate binding protein [Hallerella porci]